MQSYKAPLNDMKFILEDFLNSGASDTLFKQNDLELDDFNFILEESSKFCEEILQENHLFLRVTLLFHLKPRFLYVLICHL